MNSFQRAFQRPWLTTLSVAVFSCLGACILAPGEVDSAGEATAELTCRAGEVKFNGACHSDCTPSRTCAAAGTRCTAVDRSTSICLDANVECAYLDSDTECAGLGGAYVWSRAGSETWVPYSSYPNEYIDRSTLTPYSDPYFTPYGYQPNVGGGVGCQGNARWVSVAPTGAVACGATHNVTRCRLVGGRRCELVSGATAETVLPSK